MRLLPPLCGCAILALAPLLNAPPGASPELSSWSARLAPGDARSGEGAQVIVTAKMASGWHLYSTTQPRGGSARTSIALLPGSGLQARGQIAQPRPMKKLNPAFKITDELYQGAASFGVPVVLGSKAHGPQQSAVEVRFQLCSDRLCSPLRTVRIPFRWAPRPGSARANRRAAVASIPPQPRARQ